MMISHEHRFVFIAQPKTASVAVEAVLRPYGRGYPPPDWRGKWAMRRWRDLKGKHRHVAVRDLVPIYGHRMLREYLTFAVKRDPVDRFLSFYFFRKRDKIANPESPFFVNWTGPFSLDSYLDAIDEGDVRPPALQLYRVAMGLLTHRIVTGLLAPRRVRDGTIVTVDRLLRFEALDDDLRALCNELEVSFSGLPARNVSAHRNGFGTDDLTPDQYDRIVRLYAKDIVALGYLDRHPAAGASGHSTASGSPSSWSTIARSASR